MELLILDGFLESLDHLRIDPEDLEWGDSLDRFLEILDGFLERLDHLRIDLEDLEWGDSLDGMLERVDFEGGERLGRILE